MRTAFVALGQALVDAIAVGLVGDDKDAGFRRRGGCCEERDTSQELRKGSHASPRSQRETALIPINPND